MKKAVIIGAGVVGQATAKAFKIASFYDLDKSKANVDLKEAAQFDYVFLCVPTPVKDSGEYITDALLDTIQNLELLGFKGIYVNRSTVYPGFADNIKRLIDSKNRIISFPEFLAEATAEEDALNPDFFLVGTDIPNGEVFNIFDKIFIQPNFTNKPIFAVDNKTAETAKLAMNTFFSTKVIFANELYAACGRLGVDYDQVQQVLEKHKWGPKHHMKVWFNGLRGVRGKCLPKDTAAFNYYAGGTLVKTVLSLNKIYTKEK